MESFYILIIVILIWMTLYIYVKWSYNFWKNKNVPYFEPKLPFGNMKLLSEKTLGAQFKHFYDEMKSDAAKFGGFYLFLKPVFVPIDLEYVKCILSSDFQHFHARGFYNNEKDQPISANLFSTDGEKWKIMRAKYAHWFSSGKLKHFFNMTVQCAESMKQNIINNISNPPTNIKNVARYYTLKTVASYAFGLECTIESNDNEFYKYTARCLIDLTSFLNSTVYSSFTNLARTLKLVTFSRDVEHYFTNIVHDVVMHRQETNTKRNDFLQTLIDFKNDQERKESFTVAQITGQCIPFLLAGFESSSNIIRFCIFELAQNKLIQDKTRMEICTVISKHDDKITYDSVMEMKYLQQIINETLRKYPLLATIARKCTNNYNLPGTNVVIEKGTDIIIPVLGIHYDPEYYPEPNKFDPERFSNENIRKRHSHAYLPFGAGPRNCVGIRLGMIQVKVALAVIIGNFTFNLNPKTVLPLKFKKGLVTDVLNDILIDVDVIKK